MPGNRQREGYAKFRKWCQCGGAIAALALIMSDFKWGQDDTLALGHNGTVRTPSAWTIA